MSNKISGRVIEVKPEEIINAKSGKTYYKQHLIIETEGEYPKKICFEYFGKGTENDASVKFRILD